MRNKLPLLILLVFMMTLGASYANEVTLYVNETPMLNENIVIYENNEPYVNAVEFLEKYDTKVDWLNKAKMAVIRIEDNYLSFKIDSTEVLLNNRDSLMMDNPTMVRDGRIYVPMHFLMSQLSEEFNWIPETFSVKINSNIYQIRDSEKINLSYTDEDVLWLARIANVEANGGSVYKKMAVANVVLNRVKSPSFPNTVYEVIFAHNQFPPAYKDGFTELTPNEDSIIAAKRALNGENNVENCLYFNYIPFSGKSDDLYKNIEGDYFYF